MNTITPPTVLLFNKTISRKIYDKIVFPNYFYFEIKKDYKQSWIESFSKATKEEITATTKLPNFNYAVFENITGITEKMITARLKL